MRLRDYTPRGYNARHILILIVPMIVFVVGMTLFFFNNHVQQVNTKLSRSLAQEVAVALATLENDPGRFAALAADYSAAGLMDLSFRPGAIELQPRRGPTCCPVLREEIDQQISAPFDYAELPGDLIALRIQAPGGMLEAQFERKRVIAITAHIFIVWSVAFSVLLLATSYAFLRNQVRSILELSRAADAFGRGEDAPDFKPSGALEVRRAARSVIRMKNRIRRYADQRTAMLAGVSHDLRTPLTRLKLELALLPRDIDTAAARGDIAEMEKMLDAYLSFARSEESETPELVDLAILTREAVRHIASRADLEIIAPAPVQARVRPLALKRAIANLANNAADHAKRGRVRIERAGTGCVVAVEDDGPGIPPDRYEDAFRPFNRLDSARNQNVSGVGLGLSIARDAARSHGGDITLSRSEELGGLLARLRLPAAGPDGRETDAETDE